MLSTPPLRVSCKTCDLQIQCTNKSKRNAAQAVQLTLLEEHVLQAPCRRRHDPQHEPNRMIAHLQAYLDNTSFRIISHIFYISTIVLHGRADASIQQLFDHLNSFTVTRKNNSIPIQNLSWAWLNYDSTTKKCEQVTCASQRLQRQLAPLTQKNR